jgi:hypothetical protein
VPFVNPGTGANNSPPYTNKDGASFLFETGEGQNNYVLEVLRVV